MMFNTRKASILMVVTLCVAGCAHSDQPLSRYGKPLWRPAANAKAVKAKEASSVAILPQTHFAAAKLFESQGVYGKAITQYRKTIAVDHTFVEAYHRLGLLLSAVGKHEEALKPLQRAVQLQPDNAMLRNNYGFELLLNQRWTDAGQQLTRAVELRPYFPRAHINLGIVRSKLGRFDEALMSFRKALPEPDAYYNVGLMYRGQHRYDEAAEVFEYILTLDPSFVAAKTQLKQIISHIDPADTPEWDRPARTQVSTAADRTDLAQQRTRPARPDTTPSGTRTGESPVNTKPHDNNQSRAEPKDPLDNTIALLDEALEQLNNSGTTKPHKQTRRKTRGTREPYALDTSAEQFDIETLLLAFETEFNPLEKTESQPAIPGHKIEQGSKRDDFTARTRPTGTATPATRSTTTARTKRKDPTSSRRLAERTDRPRKRRSLERRQKTLTKDTDPKPRVHFAKRPPTVVQSKKLTRTDRRRTTEVIESFIVDESMSYADPPRLFSTVYPTDSIPFDAASANGAGSALTSCVDQWALIRQLEDQLAVVQNEINCLDAAGEIEVAGTFTHRRPSLETRTAILSTDSNFVVTPSLTSDEMEDFYGPPFNLAQNEVRRSTATRRTRQRARLAATVIDEKPRQSRQNDIKRPQQGETSASQPTTKPDSDGRQRHKAGKPKMKPTGPSARLDHWRLRVAPLHDLLEITQNELNCLQEHTGMKNETAR